MKPPWELPTHSFSRLLLSRRGVWINRLQAKLLGHILLFALLGHKRSQIEHQVPGFVRLDVVRKRRHGRAIQPGHENPIDVFVRIATLWPGSLSKVERSDLPAEVIGEGRGGWAVGLTEDAVTLPALHSGEDIAARLDAVGRDFRLGRN